MLPRAEKLEYIKREKTYLVSDFAKLKSFLLDRKSEEDQLRKFGTGEKAEVPQKDLKKCDYCGVKNHVKSECNKYKREHGDEDKSAGAGAGKGSECWTCGEKGHRSFKCPKAGGKSMIKKQIVITCRLLNVPCARMLGP